MNELINDNVKTINNVEVAEMMGIKHYQVLEKLEGTKAVKGIIPTLTDHNFMASDYFKETTYTDAQGKPRKCYDCTNLYCLTLEGRQKILLSEFNHKKIPVTYTTRSKTS